MIFWYTLKWKSNQIGLNVSVETSDSSDNRAEGPRNQFKEHWGSPCFQEQSPRAVHPSEGSWWCWHDVALWITASSPLWCQSRLTSAQQAVTMHDRPRQLQALLTSPPRPPNVLMQPQLCMTTTLNRRLHSKFRWNHTAPAVFGSCARH